MSTSQQCVAITFETDDEAAVLDERFVEDGQHLVGGVARRERRRRRRVGAGVAAQDEGVLAVGVLQLVAGLAALEHGGDRHFAAGQSAQHDRRQREVDGAPNVARREVGGRAAVQHRHLRLRLAQLAPQAVGADALPGDAVRRRRRRRRRFAGRGGSGGGGGVGFGGAVGAGHRRQLHNTLVVFALSALVALGFSLQPANHCMTLSSMNTHKQRARPRPRETHAHTVHRRWRQNRLVTLDAACAVQSDDWPTLFSIAITWCVGTDWTKPTVNSVASGEPSGGKKSARVNKTWRPWRWQRVGGASVRSDGGAAIESHATAGDQWLGRTSPPPPAAPQAAEQPPYKAPPAPRPPERPSVARFFLESQRFVFYLDVSNCEL